MSGSAEFGKCECCGKESTLARKYFYYSIKCNCCVGKHFAFVRHCETCVPKKPDKVRIILEGIEPDV